MVCTHKVGLSACVFRKKNFRDSNLSDDSIVYPLADKTKTGFLENWPNQIGFRL